MTRQRNRLADFEARSVKLMAACTLGLAGLANAQTAPAPAANGNRASLSTPLATGNTARSGPSGQEEARRRPGTSNPPEQRRTV